MEIGRRCSAFVCAVLSVLFAIFLIIPLALPTWYHEASNENGNEVDYGIFKVCVTSGRVKKCIDFEDAYDHESSFTHWRKSHQALFVTSVISAFVSVACFMATIIKYKHMFVNVAALLIVAAGGLYMAAMIVYMKKMRKLHNFNDVDYSMGPAFFCALLALLLCVVTTIATVVFRCKRYKSDGSEYRDTNPMVDVTDQPATV